jgi:3-isopropylmalate/(R)-2-methylmalate dehydratase small subunit
VKLSGRAVVIREANVDTDVLYPGAYLNVTDIEEMTQYLFEGLDPTLRDQLDGDTVLVVGRNFGAGSSREHVPQAMRASGVKALVGESFARIFYRNCINLGLPAFLNAEAAAAAEPGSAIEIDAAGTISVDGVPFETHALPPFMQDLLERGGLEDWVRTRVEAAR